MARSTLRGGESAVPASRRAATGGGAARRSAREQIGATAPDFSHPGLARANRLASAAMTRDELKGRVFAAIDRRATEIVALGERLRKHPEMGFKEAKTAGLVQETLSRLGMTPRTGLAMTGVRAEARGRGGDGPTFALIGELDGLRVTGHPKADAETGVAHACGHNAQVAGMLGAAMGLSMQRVRSSRRPDRVLRRPRRGGRRHRVASGADPGGGAGVSLRQAGADQAGSLRRRGSRHDDPHELAPRGRQGGRARVQQRPGGQDRALSRAGRACGRSAPSRDQRALRRPGRPDGHQRGERDLPRRGFHSGSPHPDPRRVAGERDPGRGAARDVRARQERGGRGRRERPGRPRASCGSARPGRPGGDRDATRPDAAPLRCVDGEALRDGGPRPGGRRALPESRIAPAPPTWAT